jgi:hypothetical protein
MSGLCELSLLHPLLPALWSLKGDTQGRSTWVGGVRDMRFGIESDLTRLVPGKALIS